MKVTGLIASICMVSILSGCTTINTLQEKGREKQSRKSLPTAQEYQDILKKVDSVQPSTLPGSKKPARWLLMDETSALFNKAESYKEYLDVDSPYRQKNVALGKVKLLKPSGGYRDTTYRVFCGEGYYRAYMVDEYTANHNKVPWLFALNSGDHDEGVPDSHIALAKHICALSGFYKGMPE